MKKTCLMIFTLLFLVSLTVWANSGGETPGASTANIADPDKAWESFAGEPIELEMWVGSSSNWGHESPDSWVWSRIREDTGVTLKYIWAGSSGEDAYNLLIASDDYPDLLFLNPINATRLMIENNKIAAYDDLKEKHGIDIVKMLNINQRFEERRLYDTDKIYIARTGGIKPEHMDSPWVVKWQTGAFMNDKWTERPDPRRSSP